MVLKKEDVKRRIGTIVPGQAWIELNGAFNAYELRQLAMEIEKMHTKANPKAGTMDGKNHIYGDKNRHNI